ncbi:MAG: hypothetical protein KGL39_42450 [Patescibacteria group bacterium]|nr:hypothetical protein [Patescibacteria group bacterium]
MANDDRYDITLTTGSTTYGFMLVTPPQQPKQLKVEEVADPDSLWLLRRNTTPETINHQDFDPKQDTPFAQGDLTGGAGQLIFNSKADETHYWWSSGVITHVSGKVYLAPPVNTLSPTLGGAATGFYSYQSPSTGTRYDFTWSGTGLWRRTASNDTNTWGKVYTAEATITDFYCFNGVGLIAYPAGTSTSYAYQSDVTAAATWTPTTVTATAFPTGTKPKKWGSVRGTVYAAVDNNKIFFGTDPTSASTWTGPITAKTPATNFGGTPGDSTYPIQALQPVNNYLFVFKQDAGWSIDSNQDTNETIWMWKTRPSSLNFPYVATADALLYYSVANEVYAYDPANGRNYPLNLSRQDGFSIVSIAGMGALGQSVFTLAQVRVPNIRSGNSMAILHSYRMSPTTWGTEVIWENTSSTSYSGLGVVPNGAGKRVYWADSGGANVYHMDIPANWDGSTTGSFVSSASIYLSQIPTGFPNFVKRHLWVGTYTENLSATYTLGISYSLDNGSTWTSLTTLSSPGNNGLNLSQFSGVDSQSIVLRLDFAGDGASTPVLRIIDLHDRVRFRYLRKVTAAVRLASAELRNGARDTQTASQILANIATLRATDAQITYQDFLGNSFPVSVDTVTYQPTLDEEPEGKYEMQAVLILPEASLGT